MRRDGQVDDDHIANHTLNVEEKHKVPMANKFSIIKADAGTPTNVTSSGVIEARNNRGSKLFVLDPLTGESTPVTQDTHAINSFAWAPDGQSMVISASTSATVDATMMYSALGANAVTLPISEVLTGLQTGIVDGFDVVEQMLPACGVDGASDPPIAGISDPFDVARILEFGDELPRALQAQAGTPRERFSRTLQREELCPLVDLAYSESRSVQRSATGLLAPPPPLS